MSPRDTEGAVVLRGHVPMYPMLVRCSVMKVTFLFSVSIHLHSVIAISLTDTEQTKQIPYILYRTLERGIFSTLMDPLKYIAPPTSLPD
jgi:hypothetical protein